MKSAEEGEGQDEVNVIDMANSGSLGLEAKQKKVLQTTKNFSTGWF